MKRQLLWLSGIIALGIASRSVHTGAILFDKYLGDALYAAMIYVLVSMVWRPAPSLRASLAMALMTAIELFQLTLIPARLMTSESLAIRLMARLMGTQFSILDLVAYSFGIIVTAGLEARTARREPLIESRHDEP
jgi:hypothetical protein